MSRVCGSDPSIYYDVEIHWPDIASGSRSRGGPPLTLSLSLRLVGMETLPFFIRSPDWAMALKSKPLCRFSWKWFRVIITWLEWFVVTTSITFPPNLWQTWKVYHPSGRAGASKYFPHRLKKKKKRETDQFVKLLSSLEFSLSPSKFLYSAYPTIVYCGQWLNLKQICHLKIKMLSPGDFKMLSKENRSKRALQLSDFFLIFFLFFFSAYSVLAKSKSWVISHCF